VSKRRAAAASGAGRKETPSNHSRRLVTQPTSWWTQKGRGRLGRSPTPQAPQGRGAQRGSRERSEREQARLRLAWSRDVERPRAFEELRLRFRVQLAENLRRDRPDPNSIECLHIVICSGRPKRDAVDEDPVDDPPNDCVAVSIDNRGHRSIEMCIRVICSWGSRTVEQTLTNSVGGCVRGVASSFLDIVHSRVIGHSSVGGSRYVPRASTTVWTNDSSRRPCRRMIAACFGDATAHGEA